MQTQHTQTQTQTQTHSRRSMLVSSAAIVGTSGTLLSGCVTPDQQTQRPPERSPFKLTAAQAHWAPVGAFKYSMRYSSNASAVAIEAARKRTHALEQEIRAVFEREVGRAVQDRLQTRNIPLGFAQHVLIAPTEAVHEVAKFAFQSTFMVTVIDAKSNTRWKHFITVPIYVPEGRPLGDQGPIALADQLIRAMADASMLG
jgi:hypothetical protein